MIKERGTMVEALQVVEVAAGGVKADENGGGGDAGGG